jgi:hypothetical protein
MKPPTFAQTFFLSKILFLQNDNHETKDHLTFRFSALSQVFFYMIPVSIVQSLANLNSVRSIGTPVRQLADL